MLNTIHLFFEQSGTFKEEFLKLGFSAFDYDIKDDFNKTDFKIDLFNEIEIAYNHQISIFDSIKSNDLIFAFFPCTRFENQIILSFQGNNSGMKNWNDLQKLEYDLKLHNELNYFYKIVTMLVIICYRKDLKLIIENPYSTQHYLYKYWPIKPKVIDLDRRENGDYFKKPTQYWFINLEPKNNFVLEPLNYNIINCKNAITCIKSIDYNKFAKNISIARSMIHSDYANRFIKQYII